MFGCSAFVSKNIPFHTYQNTAAGLFRGLLFPEIKAIPTQSHKNQSTRRCPYDNPPHAHPPVELVLLSHTAPGNPRSRKYAAEPLQRGVLVRIFKVQAHRRTDRYGMLAPAVAAIISGK